MYEVIQLAEAVASHDYLASWSLAGEPSLAKEKQRGVTTATPWAHSGAVAFDCSPAVRAIWLHGCGVHRSASR